MELVRSQNANTISEFYPHEIFHEGAIFESFFEKICVKVINIAIKIIKYSNVKNPVLVVIIKNQNENPAVTANDLNLGDDVCILDRINECY